MDKTGVDRVVIGGYSFDTDMGREAKKEQTAIDYLSKQLNMNEPATVLKVYKQIVGQNLFHTQVGYDFLKGLQNYLITNPEIDNKDVATIEVDGVNELIDAINASKAKRGEKPVNPKRGNRESAADGKYKTRAKIFMSLTIILACTVIAMFVITLTSRVPTILNYREMLNNEYSQMKEDLIKQYQQGATNSVSNDIDTDIDTNTDTN